MNTFLVVLLCVLIGLGVVCMVSIVCISAYQIRREDRGLDAAIERDGRLSFQPRTKAGNEDAGKNGQS